MESPFPPALPVSSNDQIERALGALHNRAVNVLDHIDTAPLIDENVPIYENVDYDWNKVKASNGDQGGHRQLSVRGRHGLNELKINLDEGTITRKEGSYTGVTRIADGRIRHTDKNESGEVVRDAPRIVDEKMKRSIAARALWDTKKALNKVEDETPHLREAKLARRARKQAASAQRQAEIDAARSERSIEQQESALLFANVDKSYRNLAGVSNGEPLSEVGPSGVLVQIYGTEQDKNRHIIVQDPRRKEIITCNADAQTMTIKRGDKLIVLRGENFEVMVQDQSDRVPMNVTTRVPKEEFVALVDWIATKIDLTLASAGLTPEQRDHFDRLTQLVS